MLLSNLNNNLRNEILIHYADIYA